MSHAGFVRRCNGLPYVGTREPTPDELQVFVRRRRRTAIWAWFWVAMIVPCIAWPAIDISDSVARRGFSRGPWHLAADCILGLTLFPMLAAHMFSWSRWYRIAAKANVVEVYEGTFLDLDSWEWGAALDQVVVPGRIEMVVPTAWYWRTTDRGRALCTEKAGLSYVAETPSPLPSGTVALSEDECRELALHRAQAHARNMRSLGGSIAMLLIAAGWMAVGWPAAALLFAAIGLLQVGKPLGQRKHLNRMDADLADRMVDYDDEERSARLVHSEMHWVICGLPAPWRFDQPWVRFRPAEGPGSIMEP